MQAISIKRIDPLQLHELQKFGSRINRYGVNFAVSDTTGNLVVFCERNSFRSNKKQLEELGIKILSSCNEKNDSVQSNREVIHSVDKNYILAIILESYCSEYKPSEAVGIAIVDFGDISSKLENTQFLYAIRASRLKRHNYLPELFIGFIY